MHVNLATRLDDFASGIAIQICWRRHGTAVYLPKNSTQIEKDYWSGFQITECSELTTKRLRPGAINVLYYYVLLTSITYLRQLAEWCNKSAPNDLTLSIGLTTANAHVVRLWRFASFIARPYSKWGGCMNTCREILLAEARLTMHGQPVAFSSIHLFRHAALCVSIPIKIMISKNTSMTLVSTNEQNLHLLYLITQPQVFQQ